MKNYLVTAEVTISLHTEVEAANKQEARKLAKERPLQKIDDNGAETAADTWMTSGELDGDVCRVKVEES